MKIGYARVSTTDQNPSLQINALKAAGCDPIFFDHGVSGASVAFPALQEALGTLTPNDLLVVWKLDRLGRSLQHVINTLNYLGTTGAGFQSLTEAIDTTTAQGRLLFHLMGALAEFERSLIVERTQAGLAAARRRGVVFGRIPKLTPEKLSHARALIKGGEDIGAVLKSIGVSKPTYYRHLRKNGGNLR
jgi:DNA invertase Pin-like site-specific DNA recombinase